MEVSLRTGRLTVRSLLATSSVAALLIGAGAPAAFAQCAVNDVGVSTGPITNSAAINCINIQNSTVTGNVTNTGSGTITATGVTRPSSTGITINNSTIGGTLVNAGKISATAGAGIAISSVAQFGSASAGGGISNSGTITATEYGISLNATSFYGGIVNAAGATISGFRGIVIENGSLFAGGISNRGTLIGTGSTALRVGGISTFQGGISNSGTISGPTGIVVGDGSIFTGGISNSGTISATGSSGIIVDSVAQFGSSSAGGGITNSGTISAAVTGIAVANVTAFLGGISNAGTIAANATSAVGLHVANVATFSGGLTNSGEISGLGPQGAGINVSNVATFLGGITNSGTVSGLVRAVTIETETLFSGGITNSGLLSSAFASGLLVDGITTFVGNIKNSGTISATQGIWLNDVATFAGGISNSGTISAANVDGINVQTIVQFGSSSAGGGITNTGSISAGASGIGVTSVSTFSGGITNAGTISAAKRGIGLGFAPTPNKFGVVSNFSGNVANSGSITAGATGIAVTASTFTGNVSNSGTISAGGRGIGLGFHATTGAVYGISTFAGNVSNSGRITAATGIYIGADVTFAAGGAIVNSGTITGTTSAIDATAATSPVIVDINGGAISGNILGAGTTSGDTVNFALGSGSFAYANRIAGMQAVNINSGTLFDGGTILAAGVVVNSGGTLAPGLPNTTDTLSIIGNVTFNAGSGYEVMITNAGTNSSTTVTGDTTINGGTVEVKPLEFGHYNATTYTLLIASGGVTVHTPFGGPAFVGPFAYTGSATLTYPTDKVDLVLGPGYVDFAAPPGAGQNQQNVVTAIDNYITSGGALPPGFANLGNLSGSAYLNTLTQLDGEDATGAQTSAFQMMTQFLDLMIDPAAGGGAGGGSGATGFADEAQQNLPPDVALAYARALHKPLPQQSFDQRWSAWGSGFGGSGTYDGNATVGSTNVTASDYGYAGGMDYHLTPDTAYGFALGGGGTNWNLATSLGGGRSDSFEAGVYAKTHWGAAYLSGALGFANHWFTTNRIAVGDQLTASFQGQSYAARGEAGYRYAIPIPGYIIGVTPYAALQVQDFHTPGYSETDLSGGGLGLTYSSMSATDTRSELGARFDNLTVWDGMPLVLRGRLAWAHDWVSNPALGAVFEALPGSNFTVNGAAVPQNSALTTAAAELHLTAHWTAIAKFDGEFASTAQTYAGTGTLKYSW